MARRCEICGRGPITGHSISHAHNLSKRRWNLDLHRMRVVTPQGNRRLRVCTRCLRSGRVKKAVRGTSQTVS